MEIEVVKAASTFDLWTSHPFVFRAVALPLYVIGVLYISLDNRMAELVILGEEGEKVDLKNPEALNVDADPDHIEARAFVADAVYSLGMETDDPVSIPHSLLMALQSAVWCLLGTQTSLVLFGDHGGRVPEWAWKPENQGPHLHSVRITPLGTNEP